MLRLLALLCFSALVLLSAATNSCGDQQSCGDACYNSNDYNCWTDPTTQRPILCPAGTENCASNCIASCGYTCQHGQIQQKQNNTCPPSCLGGQSPCGQGCYDSSAYCCISGKPTDTAHCPGKCETYIASSPCNFTLCDVGELWDGQLRASFGPGANWVGFSLKDGVLRDDRGQICYSSANSQLQCNTVPQNPDYANFGISSDGYLVYKGNAIFYQSAVGTGGYNIFTQQVPNSGRIALKVQLYCPATTSSTKATSSTKWTTSSTVTPSVTGPCNKFTLDNTGQLPDGQIRYNYGADAMDVSFTLNNGALTDNRGQTCYISTSNQLQCNTPPQTNDKTSFGIKNGYLSYKNSITFYKSATGTGGFNVYTTKVNSEASEVKLKVKYSC